MAQIDKQYNNLLQTILDKGRWYNDPNREGVRRLQIPRYNFEYDLKKGFPILTTKKINFKNIVGELLWFLRGDTNIKYLVDNGINIWNKDAYNYYLSKNKDKLSLEEFIEDVKANTPGIDGDLGRIYGAQWRNWESFKEEDNGLLGVIKYAKHTDQISNLIKNLKEKPLATDHIVTAWNPAELDEMALPPCHKGFQLMVYELTPLECAKYADKSKVPYKGPKYGFDLVWEQRSVDTFLGLPYNIASYALLAHIIGKMVNMVPGKIYGDLRNVHLYDNSIEAAKKQLMRKTDKYWKPTKLLMEDIDLVRELSTDDIIKKLRIDMFKLENYESYPGIKVEMLSRDE